MMPKTSNVDQARTKRAALLVATLGAFLTPFGGSSVIIALPSIGKEFAMDAISLSWVVTVYLLTTAIFLVPFGNSRSLWEEKNFYLRHRRGVFFDKRFLEWYENRHLFKTPNLDKSDF